MCTARCMTGRESRVVSLERWVRIDWPGGEYRHGARKGCCLIVAESAIGAPKGPRLMDRHQFWKDKGHTCASTEIVPLPALRDLSPFYLVLSYDMFGSLPNDGGSSRLSSQVFCSLRS